MESRGYDISSAQPRAGYLGSSFGVSVRQHHRLGLGLSNLDGFVRCDVFDNGRLVKPKTRHGIRLLACPGVAAATD